VANDSVNQDSYTIDPEMTECICVELGIEPVEQERREIDLEEAERHAMRRAKEEMDEEAKNEEEERYAALDQGS